MIVLPIRQIIDLDQPVFGANLFNLAKLARDDFGVAQGLALSPPEFLLQTVIKHFKYASQEVFEQRLVLLKNELIASPIPPELEEELKKKSKFYLQGEIIKNKSELWLKLLQLWLEEIKKRLWQEGFTQGITLNLTPQLVYFVSAKLNPVKAYFDPHLDEVIIKSAVKIDPADLKKIDQVVLQANKKLFIPQVYQFLVGEGKAILISLSPFTQTLPVSKTADIVIPKKEQQALSKYAIKLFLNLSSGFAIEKGVDGILIEGERVENLYHQIGFEQTIFKLSEAGLSFINKPVIYKLPDIKDKDISGSIRLIHDQKLLDQATKAFLFARNKRNLLNLEIALPKLCSADELLQLKRELAVRGITRKGTLKLWMEVAIPENIINLEDYQAVGIDGVILNLDHLQQLLGGYSLKDEKSFSWAYKNQVGALIKFIKPLFKSLHKVNIPVLILGEQTLHPDILEMVIEEGAYGVVVNTLVEASSIPDHLSWMERRMAAKRLS